MSALAGRGLLWIACVAMAACEGTTIVAGSTTATTTTPASFGGAGGAGGVSSPASGAGGSMKSVGGASQSTGTPQPPPQDGGPGGLGGAPGAGGGQTTTATSSGGPCGGIADAIELPGGHCYVDRTPPGGATFLDAEVACDALVPGASHVVTIHSDAEQSFVVANFLLGPSGAPADADAWLGLTCGEAAHPVFADCYCDGGCKTPLERKLHIASWAWVDGTQTPFIAWLGTSPNGAGRAAALAWDAVWGWVDRAQDAKTADGPSGPITHRVICEIE